MSNDYDEQERGNKMAKRVLGLVGILVVLAITFGFFQAARAIAGRGSDVVNSKVIESKETSVAVPTDDVAIADPQSTGMNTQPYDGGVGKDDLGVIFDFGTVAEMPFPGQQAIDRVVNETELVPGYIGLAGTPVKSIDDCEYLSLGYYKCPIGGAYYQIIDSKYQFTFAFAKQGSEMPSSVLDAFKTNFSEASEGLGGGALEGYYIVSRGAVQNLS